MKIPKFIRKKHSLFTLKNSMFRCLSTPLRASAAKNQKNHGKVESWGS